MTTMTRQNYELIADSLRKSYGDLLEFNLSASREEIDEIYAHLVVNLASALATTNPNFDHDKFTRACDLEG
jgi:hypothetical protein